MKSANLPNAILFLACIVLLTAIVFGNAYSSGHGYVSPDSANYLRLAQRLLDGNGLYVPANGRVGPDEIWFAVWPPGYSIIIAAVSGVTGANVFLASKIANVILFSATLGILFRFLGRDGLIASTILLSGGTLQIFSMSWSEVPFLLSIVTLSLVLAAVANKEIRLNIGFVPVFTILLVLPFLFRYVGVFIFAPVCIAVLHLLVNSRRREAWLLLLAAGIAVTGCVVYLWHNWLQTGHLTGVQRIPAPESHATLVTSFFATVIRELMLPLTAWNPQSLKQSALAFAWVALALLLAIRLIYLEKAPIDNRTRVFVFYFVAFGAIYTFSIAFLRWNSHFDGFSYRLLDPGFSLLSIGAVLWILGIFRQHEKLIISFLIVTACLSISLHAYQIFNRNGLESYADQIQRAAARYANIPDAAIVIFGQNELRYLRPNIQVAYPSYRPYSSIDEEWNTFLGTLQTGVPIFVENGARARISGRFHPSVRDAVGSLPEDELTRISP